MSAHPELPTYQIGYDFPWITRVTPLSPYKIYLSYSDGVAGEIDLSDCVKMEMFSEWQTPGAFGKVKIGEYGEVWWSDVASLCPDALYLELTGKEFDEVSSPHSVWE